MERRIIHIDMDAFYAQIEQRDHPEYRGKPLIVGGRSLSRGVVATASYEARKFGVHSAMPTRTAHKLCPDGIYVRPRFDVYKSVSDRKSTRLNSSHVAISYAVFCLANQQGHGTSNSMFGSLSV